MPALPGVRQRADSRSARDRPLQVWRTAARGPCRSRALHAAATVGPMTQGTGTHGAAEGRGPVVQVGHSRLRARAGRAGVVPVPGLRRVGRLHAVR